MRSCLLFLILLFACSTGNRAQDTLLLFHPNKYNIEVIENLVQKELLNLEGFHVLGVYHSREASEYETASEKVAENPNGIFSLLEINVELEADKLFGTNLCTPLFKELFNKSKGALFMGGPDIPPHLYDEPVNLLTRVTDPFRHFLEASFIFHLLGGNQDAGWVAWMKDKDQYLLSGICLGMQTMNVATGGTLIQDIPTEVYGVWIAEDVLTMPPDQRHRNYMDMVESDCGEYTSYHFHQLSLSGGSFLQKNLKIDRQSTPLVLSSHHQAIESTGKGWDISATSMDGKIIEAIEHEVFPHVFGVQFHPEKPGLFDPGITDPVACSGEINFYDQIKGSVSSTFHTAYWNYIGMILQEGRK